MNWVDLLVVVVLGVGVFSGLRRGLIRQVLGLTSLIASFVIGYMYMDGAGEWIEGQAGIPEEYSPVAGFLAVFMGMQLCFMIGVRFLDGIVKKIVLVGGLNRILGAALGILSSGLLLSLTFYLASLFGIPSDDARISSALYEHVYELLPYAWNLATQHFPELTELSERFPSWFVESSQSTLP
ncbi:MAG: CvpA family protein [Bacteroidetes bacterium]|nr:CvpA family protein [Bacteroidota bacterium]MCY4205933.1 CvpA family protein [Bacteroidota bacterium]